MKTLNTVKTKIVTLGSVIGATLVTSTVNAADYTSQITAAQGDATTNVTAVIAAVISVAAAGFCAGIFISWLKK